MPSGAGTDWIVVLMAVRQARGAVLRLSSKLRSAFIKSSAATIRRGPLPNPQPRPVRQVSTENPGAAMAEVYLDCARPHAQRCLSRVYCSASYVLAYKGIAMSGGLS
ncbi:hypothetical protein EDD17DRAFT_636447 [Pisolithus thermaeus]|nr:hypothetical protein EDD17DRAFT_636447 [Pisolithus thermaeus]